MNILSIHEVLDFLDCHSRAGGNPDKYLIILKLSGFQPMKEEGFLEP